VSSIADFIQIAN